MAFTFNTNNKPALRCFHFLTISLLFAIFTTKPVSSLQCYSCANCVSQPYIAETCPDGYDYCLNDYVNFGMSDQISYKLCAKSCQEASGEFIERTCCAEDLCNGSAGFALTATTIVLMTIFSLLFTF